MEGEGEASNVWSPMEGKGEASNAWRLMEGKGEVSNVQRPMEGEGKASNAWRPMEGERETSFSPFSTSPPSNLLKLSSFSFDLTILLYHNSRPLFRIPSFCPWPINYDAPFDVIGPSFVVDSVWLKILSFLLEIMASRMATSYGLQTTHVNEEPAL
jgi:hypothetical protein